METMPSQGLISAPIPEQSKNRFGSDGSEEAIQACYDLLSSGYPLSEILVALKRLGPLNKVQSELRGARGDTKIYDIGGEFSDESSRWQIAKAAEPVESKRSLTAVHVPQFPEHAGDAERLSIKWSRPIGIALFWLIPAISLTVAGIAGKLLIDAHLLW